MKLVPNVLSGSRIPLGLAVSVTASLSLWAAAWWLFAAACLTDLIDGPLARQFGAQSQSGERIDHTADFVLFIGTWIGLTVSGVLPVSMLISGAVCLGAGWFLRRGDAKLSNDGASVIVFVSIMVALAAALLVKAFGPQLWFVPAGITLLSALAYFKRGRLQS